MGVVNRQYTFAANDVITSTKMNDIIDQTTIDETAILGNTLEVAGGKLKVRSQGITSNELAASAVTNTQIANGSVTYDKLGAGGPAWDGNGTLYSNGLRLSSNAPILNFNETDTGKQWFWVADGSGFSLRFNDYNTYSLSADGSGNVTFFQNATTNGTSTVNGAATFASTASFAGNVAFNSGAITSKGYAGSTAKGVVFLGDASNGYIYNNGTHLEFSSPTGGTSYLSSSGTIWQSGNDGAGSGLDADLLDGLQPSAANAVDTIVRRDGNGDSGFRNINCTSLSATYAGLTGLGVTNLISGTTSGNIKQSGGANQLANVVYMGWRADATLGVQVDSTSFGNNWPINITGTATTATTAIAANTVTDGAITASKLSGAQTGAAPVYGARAYANFNCNGVAIGGLALKGSSGNIGNITKLAVGKYNIAFSTAMPSSGYAIIGTCNNNTTGAAGVSGVIVPYAQAADGVNVSISDVNSSALYDPQWCNIVIFA